MNYGFHLATGGVLAAMRRMDVVANNLAQVNTAGFKPDFVVARERPAERIEGLSPLADPMAPPQELLEKLGGGIRFDRDRIDLSQGSIELTGSKTDLALRGEGFFALTPAGNQRQAQGGRGGRNQPPLEVTRAGALVVDRDGTIRSADSGRTFMGENGRALRIDPTMDFRVDSDGRIFQDGDEVGRFRIVRPKDVLTLEKQPENVLRINGAWERVRDDDVEVQQSALERSSADPVTSMVELTRQSRMLESALRMMQYQDQLNGQAIAGIARIA
jgi:flagellar basal-body rod protein FlgF